jgi:hypothetical protein
MIADDLLDYVSAHLLPASAVGRPCKENVRSGKLLWAGKGSLDKQGRAGDH